MVSECGLSAGAMRCEALQASRHTLLLHEMVELQATCKALVACRRTHLLNALVEVCANCAALQASRQIHLRQAQQQNGVLGLSPPNALCTQDRDQLKMCDNMRLLAR